MCKFWFWHVFKKIKNFSLALSSEAILIDELGLIDIKIMCVQKIETYSFW